VSASVEQARRALGTRLREIREDAGLTGRAFASAAGWHYTKVSKLENGARCPSQADIRAWCRICHAEDQVPELVAAARSIETSYAEWRRQLRAGMHRAQAARLPVYEQATRFRLYEPGLIPGILQTAEYAAAVIRSFLAFTQAARDVNEAVAARMEWQRIIYSHKEFLVILEEQALRTRVGGPEVMEGQLDRLLAVMSLPSMSLGIIPLGAERKVMPSGGFLIFDDEMVQAETVSAELTVTEPREVALYARRFEFLSQSAVTGRDARGLIRRALGEIARLSSPTSVNIVVPRNWPSVASSLRSRSGCRPPGRGRSIYDQEPGCTPK
jgi:transcriptional regulator with XRE-family HTH domain